VRALAENRTAAERSIAHAGAVDSHELQTLSAFQARVARQSAALVEGRQVLDRETAAQLAKNIEAQRRVKLLERLREQRLREWTSAMDAEQESFAAEAWLGRWPTLKTGDGDPPRLPGEASPRLMKKLSR
jgi:hypothetical protein